MRVNTRFVNASRSTSCLRIFCSCNIPQLNTWRSPGICNYILANEFHKVTGCCVLPFNFLNLFEDVHLVEFMYLVCTWCQVRVTKGDSGLCCCVHAMSLKRKLIPHTLLILCKHSRPHSVSDCDI